MSSNRMDDGKARRAAIFEGTYQPRRKAVPTTIADFAPRFLQAKRHLRTVRKYRQQIGQYLAPHFGRKPLEAIAGHDCLDYYNSRLDTDAAVSTVNGEMACLKLLFSEATALDIKNYWRCTMFRLAAGDDVSVVVSFNSRERLLVIPAF